MEAERRELLRNLMTSPVEDFEPFENEDEILGDTTVRQDDEDDEGEELFGDNMENDYRPRPELDQYDARLLDEDDYSDISEGDRRAAEIEMSRRDRALVSVNSVKHFVTFISKLRFSSKFVRVLIVMIVTLCGKKVMMKMKCPD